MNIVTLVEAKARGLHTYYTGRPCKHGHMTYRYVAGKVCAQCAKNKAKRQATVGGGNARRWASKTQEQRDSINAKRREYYIKTRDARLKERKAYYEKVTSDADLLEQRRAYFRAWKKTNPGKVNADTAKRRGDRLCRTPAWADTVAIVEFYKACPEGHHVDHIVPLRGKYVSGLHVEYNLQYLPAVENLRKANRYEPA